MLASLLFVVSKTRCACHANAKRREILEVQLTIHHFTRVCIVLTAGSSGPPELLMAR